MTLQYALDVVHFSDDTLNSTFIRYSVLVGLVFGLCTGFVSLATNGKATTIWPKRES